MVDMRRSQADADGMVFAYLGVKINGTDVWTTGHEPPSRCLGDLRGASAGIDEPRRSRIGTFISSVLVSDTRPKNARLYVAFADGTRYERRLLPWAYMDWPKIAREIGRFNAIAHSAMPL